MPTGNKSSVDPENGRRVSHRSASDSTRLRLGSVAIPPTRYHQRRLVSPGSISAAENGKFRSEFSAPSGAERFSTLRRSTQPRQLAVLINGGVIFAERLTGDRACYVAIAFVSFTLSARASNAMQSRLVRATDYSAARFRGFVPLRETLTARDVFHGRCSDRCSWSSHFAILDGGLKADASQRTYMEEIRVAFYFDLIDLIAM